MIKYQVSERKEARVTSSSKTRSKYDFYDVVQMIQDNDLPCTKRELSFSRLLGHALLGSGEPVSPLTV